MRTNKKATKLCDMRKTHWWDHSTITNKTFDCLICEFSPWYLFLRSSCSHQLWKRGAFCYAYLWNLHICMTMKKLHLKGEEGEYLGDLSISVPLKGLRLVQPGTGPQRHQRCRIFISPSYTHSTSICFLLFPLMTSLATTVHISA